ncbi:MAG: CRISPR-associated ring nuclease [Candidatus Korarchaeum sp.]
MATVIAPLGLSPPVVTEFVQWLELEGIDVRDVILIETSERDVLAGAKLVKVALQLRYPRLRVGEVLLDYPDVDNQERAFDFMEKLVELVGSLERKRVYLLISGGRKVMSVALALVSQFFPSEVYHVVARDVKIANMELERLRPRVLELYESEDPLSYYEADEDLKRLMFPPASEYDVIRLPTIPYPDQVLSEVKRALEGAKREEVGFNLVALLSEMGLIQVAGGRTVATQVGRRLLRILDRIV